MLAKILFVASIAMLAFAYGVITTYLEIFPYKLVRDAKIAFESWYEVIIEGDKPVNLEFADNEGEAQPQIIFHDQSLQGDGYILMTGGPYALMSECPEFGCLAWIMNRNGEVLHSWEVDLGKLWEDTPDHIGRVGHEKISPMGMHVSANGDLTVSFQTRSTFPYGLGIARFDKDGEVIWRKDNFSHHWFSIAPDGTIYTPSTRLVESPQRVGLSDRTLECDRGTIYDDTVLILDPNGETIDEISVIDLVVDAGFLGLMYALDDHCDPIHLNFVEYVTEELARDVPDLEAGDFIISIRHLHLVAAVDGASKKIKWAMAGQTVGQHSPRLLPGGDIIVLDNGVGTSEMRGSRLVEVEYGSHFAEPIFPPPEAAEDVDFWTHSAGHMDLNPAGTRALVSSTRQGRVLEVDLESRRVLWELVNTHDLEAHADDAGIDENGTVGRLATMGAYYVGRPAFLEGNAGGR